MGQFKHPVFILIIALKTGFGNNFQNGVASYTIFSKWKLALAESRGFAPTAFAVAPKGQLKPSGLISSVGKAQIARAKRVKSRVACHFFRNEKSYALD